MEHSRNRLQTLNKAFNQWDSLMNLQISRIISKLNSNTKELTQETLLTQDRHLYTTIIYNSLDKTHKNQPKVVKLGTED